MNDRSALSLPVASDEFNVQTISIGGLPIAVIDKSNSSQLMIAAALARRGSGRRPVIISSANGHVISLCARDPQTRALFRSCDLLHADGMPLVLASRLKCSKPLPERVATTDLFPDVASLAQKAGATFYFLGASADVINAAIRNVRRRYPDLTITGFRSGYFSHDEEANVIAEINAARPDILWVGMGVPREQDFALRNRERLINVGLIKTAGGLFDFLSGKNRRAPAWMQAAGLEWLYRLALEPTRLLVRYLTTNPHALYLLLTQTYESSWPPRHFIGNRPER